jgi:hypothetical protein
LRDFTTALAYKIFPRPDNSATMTVGLKSEIIVFIEQTDKGIKIEALA